MSKISNLSVFKFGINLNMMFSVVLGITKIKLEKKVLVLNKRLNLSTNTKMDVIDLDSINLDSFDFTQYSVIVLDSNVNQSILDVASKTINEDVVFIVCSYDNSNVDEYLYTYIDFEELSTLPMFKKIAKVNEIRNKLKVNKSLKKFKFFKIVDFNYLILNIYFSYTLFNVY